MNTCQNALILLRRLDAGGSAQEMLDAILLTALSQNLSSSRLLHRKFRNVPGYIFHSENILFWGIVSLEGK